MTRVEILFVFTSNTFAKFDIFGDSGLVKRRRFEGFILLKYAVPGIVIVEKPCDCADIEQIPTEYETDCTVSPLKIVPESSEKTDLTSEKP